ncbi:MAG: DNA-3-methyladenine glycosylase I [Clostridia bacterium]
MSEPGRSRCGWVPDNDALYQAYHDDEWGVPVHDDRALFEALVLDGAQAGLTWRSILVRRPDYRRAFHNFEIDRVARLTADDEARLVLDAGIIRNRAKIRSAVQNARAALIVTQESGSLDRFLWSFVGGAPRVNRWSDSRDIPADSEESKAMSRELRRRRFTFVGPVICYAFMQAVGMVMDHTTSCFRYRDLTSASGVSHA